MTRTSLKFTLVATASALAMLLVPGLASAAKVDKNRDGIPDRWERKHGLSLKVNQRAKDQDRDGLRNLAEFRSATNPKAVDSDQDGVDDTDEDRDGDSVDNGNEQREGTLPNDTDTNNDGQSDAAEDADADGLVNAAEDSSGNDPVDSDTDNDTTSDGSENVGTVQSYDPSSGLLEILLADGSVLSGTVDGTTAIYCADEDEHEDLNEADDRSTNRLASRDGEESDGEDPADGEDGNDGTDGDDGSESGDDAADNGTCAAGVSLLAPGARIHEASLDTATGVFLTVEIVSPDSSDDQEVENAVGQIESFDGTTLVVANTDGSTTSGTVNGSTEIECKGLYDEEEDEGACSTADLIPGTVVHEIEVEGGIVDKVQLLN